MPRPRKIADARILDAARARFLEAGYAASTASIARAADVSQAILFQRYGTKDALFYAAMELRLPDCLGASADLSDERDVRRQLIDLAPALGRFLHETVNVAAVVRGSRRPGHADWSRRAAERVAMVRAYIKSLLDDCAPDASIASDVFLGALMPLDWTSRPRSCASRAVATNVLALLEAPKTLEPERT